MSNLIHIPLGPFIMSNLIHTGRRTIPKFRFTLSNEDIEVNIAQILVEGVFESQSPEQHVFLFEAKVGVPSSFRIQQLYYPFRTLMNKNLVRNFFFCFEPRQKIYFFWEYKFSSYDHFESIKLIQSKYYQMKVSKIIPIKMYQNISLDSNKTNIL